MNPLKFLKYLIVSIIVVLSSCSGSDDDTSNNIIKFNGGKFRLYRGYQYKYSEAMAEQGTPFVVLLLGDGVSFDKSSSTLSGTGSMISFYMYSENAAEIKQGEYTIDIFSKKPVFSADSCEVFYNYDFAQDTGKYFNIKGGTFNVTNLGSVMSYEISLVTDTILFKGDYRGPIQTL